MSLPETTPKKYNIWSALQSVISVAILMATLFTLWTPGNLFSNNFFDQMLLILEATDQPIAAPVNPIASFKPHIGIVAGHWGNENDPGAVCSDGLTEVETNLKIASFVQQQLIAEGFEVDLLQEFDENLFQYQALALVSIHNDSCDFINSEATGFKVAAALSNAFPEKAERLTACLIHRYQAATNLNYHSNTITPDMTSYHAFNEVHSTTPAAIIETGFLNLDRQILTENPEIVAGGITAGLICYIRNEPIPKQTLETPSP